MNDETLAISAIRLPEHVVYRQFAAETVVLNLETGQYHGLNPTAGRILSGLESADDVTSVVQRVAEEFGQPVERVHTDTIVLLRALLERGLILVIEPEAARAE